MDNNTVDKKRNKSFEFQDFVSMDVENISIKPGNNDPNYIIHIKHCNKQPKQAKHSIILVEILIWTQKLLLMKSG